MWDFIWAEPQWERIFHMQNWFLPGFWNSKIMVLRLGGKMQKYFNSFIARHESASGR